MHAHTLGTSVLHLALNLFAVLVAGKTCTDVETSYTTVTPSLIEYSTTLPVVTHYRYRYTVLKGTPYTGANPLHTGNGDYSCFYETGYTAPPPPSSSSVPAPTTAQPAAATAAAGGKCTTTTTTTTTTTVAYQCTYTQIIAPPPVIIHKRGTLTTAVPSFCTQGPCLTNGTVDPGDVIKDIGYPYFAQTGVECCVACSTQFHDLVAAGFIKSGLDCECLVNKKGDYPDKSKTCPNGVDPYVFGDPQPKGNIYRGPCGT